jgi:hypothetical protein
MAILGVKTVFFGQIGGQNRAFLIKTVIFFVTDLSQIHLKNRGPGYGASHHDGKRMTRKERMGTDQETTQIRNKPFFPRHLCAILAQKRGCLY